MATRQEDRNSETVPVVEGPDELQAPRAPHLRLEQPGHAQPALVGRHCGGALHERMGGNKAHAVLPDAVGRRLPGMAAEGQVGLAAPQQWLLEVLCSAVCRENNEERREQGR